jgi:hypothetical protein
VRRAKRDGWPHRRARRRRCPKPTGDHTGNTGFIQTETGSDDPHLEQSFDI